MQFLVYIVCPYRWGFSKATFGYMYSLYVIFCQIQNKVDWNIYVIWNKWFIPNIILYAQDDTWHIYMYTNSNGILALNIMFHRTFFEVPLLLKKYKRRQICHVVDLNVRLVKINARKHILNLILLWYCIIQNEILLQTIFNWNTSLWKQYGAYVFMIVPSII